MRQGNVGTATFMKTTISESSARTTSANQFLLYLRDSNSGRSTKQNRHSRLGTFNESQATDVR